ncbi:MAG: hypothetical protein KGK16_17795, partial [Bradyrhizobium sp.]|nr:hypothetical protein [Bradyrhizobium sp.]
ARLDEMFKRRFEHRQTLRRAREPVEAASFEVMRSLAGSDARLAAAVKNAHKLSTARAKEHPKHPKRAKVQARQRLGSVAVTMVPPFWPWQWTATTGGATATANADGGAGTLNFDA